MKRILALMFLLCLLTSCSGKPEADTSTKKKQPSDREQIESEVREGGLRDPGGAKDVRDQAAEDQKQQQEEAQKVDDQ